MAITLAEMDDRVTFGQQLQQETGPVVLINTFNVAPEEAEGLLAVWAEPQATRAGRQPSPTPEPSPTPTVAPTPTEPGTAVVEETEVIVETEVVPAPTATALAEATPTPEE